MPFGLDPVITRSAGATVPRLSLLFPERVPAAAMVRTSAVMGPRVGCPPLDMAGRTVNSPCVSWLGCNLEDFQITRGLFAIEHNALVGLLNAWNAAVAAGKATWTTVPIASWEKYETSWKLLSKYPADYGSGWLDTDGYFIKSPIIEFIQMAMLVHQASCDMRVALAGIGEQVPGVPDPIPEPKGVVEKVFEGGKDVVAGAASGVVNVALGLGGAALLIAVAYSVYSRGARKE
jgi:hypothetical protein